MDSRDRLVGSNSPHVNLALQLLPAGQDDMQEDNPITCHFEPKASLVAAGLDFLRFTEDGRHARMRHICLNGDVRSRDCSRRRIGQPDNHNRADPGRRRGDFVFNRDRVRRVRWPRAGCDKHTRAQAHNRRLRHSFGEGEPAARSVERGIPCCESRWSKRTVKRAWQFCLWQLSRSPRGPIRKCRPCSPAHPRAETCGSTFRPPWG